MERVRAKALAMQSSEDLIKVARELRHQMGLLGQPELESANIHLYGEHEDTYEVWWTFRPSAKPAGEVLSGHCLVPIDSCEYSRETISEYRSEDTEYVIESRGNKLVEWYKILEQLAPETVEYDDNDEIILPEVLYYHYCKFSGGALLMISNELQKEEVRALQNRAARVFDFAYRRFIDLQTAEKQTRKAVRQASLDRVRAEIASMRSTDDLQRITPLIWSELTTLQIPFIRCGVFIVHEQDQMIHAYLSTPEGESLAVLHLPFDSSEFVQDSIDHWRRQEVYVDTWDRKQFIAWTKLMIDRGFLEDAKQYQGGEQAPENLVLQYVPFNRGMLYVGTEEPLQMQELELVHSLADSFAIAYSRYEDFKHLEEANTQIESALKDLKITQSQLIQSEKMASLGELTAGIAHEIQNPLNFVNNFSEVSTELIDELNLEVEKGDMNEVKVISSDLKHNLQKINEHGRRASSIVRGMLDHSRTTAGEKVETDLNALCDEYLRLAYHGFRAKDKSFHADMHQDLDPDIPKISVVPQDMGRVILNLINNAFQACTEQLAVSMSKGSRSTRTERSRSTNLGDFKPLVSVNTKLAPLSEAGIGGGEWVTITISDNGPGIPDEIKDKIFQPFFTTKPTGQGTGLGLSLSYDIVTAHGGLIDVESQVGQGTQFIITLPLNHSK